MRNISFSISHRKIFYVFELCFTESFGEKTPWGNQSGDCWRAVFIRNNNKQATEEDWKF